MVEKAGKEKLCFVCKQGAIIYRFDSGSMERVETVLHETERGPAHKRCLA